MTNYTIPSNDNEQLVQAQHQAANLLIDVCAGNTALALLCLSAALDSFNPCRVVAIQIPVYTVQ